MAHLNDRDDAGTGPVLEGDPAVLTRPLLGGFPELEVVEVASGAKAGIGRKNRGGLPYTIDGGADAVMLEYDLLEEVELDGLVTPVLVQKEQQPGQLEHRGVRVDGAASKESNRTSNLRATRHSGSRKCPCKLCHRHRLGRPSPLVSVYFFDLWKMDRIKSE